MPISVLRASPYSHPWGASIYAKVVAINLVGESSESVEGNSAIILTQPDKPINVANDASVTNAQQIGLTWQEGAANGGATVEDYRITYDQGGSTYIDLATGVTSTSYTTTITLTPGTTYKFKIEARNTYGYSDLSDEVSILAAQVPDAPVSLANDATVTSSTQVGLTWSAGAYNGGVAIDDYRVSYD